MASTGRIVDLARAQRGVVVARRARLYVGSVRWIRPVDPWLWPVLLMALIFVLSAQSALSSGLGVLDLVGRKVGHAALYGLLCWLWARALSTRLPVARATAWALAISVLYAASDEYHQSFVLGRVGSPLDVVIDAAGAVAVAYLFRRAGRRPVAREEPRRHRRA